MKNQQYSSWIGKSDENPHHQDHDHHGQMMRSISSDDCSHVIIRPYTCAFCNRGFSSAQALGGHMNIHRKDRAKLKLQALAATAAAKQEDHEDQENMPLDPRVFDDDEDFFLLESHQRKRADHIPDKRPGSAQDHATSTSLSLSRSLSVPELDLELRLGPASLPAG